MFSPWVQIFATGTHTGTRLNDKGEREPVTLSYTEDDLKARAELYNNQSTHVAPVTIGHPVGDRPSYGWVDRLQAVGGRLYARFRDFSPTFVQAVREGKFRERSAAFYSGGLLRHVAFLGDVPPAVKGMDPVPVEFNEADSIPVANDGATFRFAEGDPPPNSSSSNNAATMEETLKQILAALQGLPDAVATKVAEATKKTDGGDSGSGDTGSGDGGSFAESDEYKALQADLDKARAEATAATKKAREAEFKEYLNSPALRIRVAAGERPSVLATLEALSGQNEIELTEGEGDKAKTVKASPLDLFKKTLEARKPVVDESAFRELAAGDNAPDAATIEANEYQKAGSAVAASLKPVRNGKA